MYISACELDPLFSAPQFYSSCILFDPQKVLFDHDAVQDSHENLKFEILLCWIFIASGKRL